MKSRIRRLSNNWKQDLESVQQYIERLEADNIRLTERLIEYNKDDEIAKLKAEMDELRCNSFIRWSKEERIKRDEAWTDHAIECNGKNIYYRVCPTGIGEVVYICCDKCGMKKVIKNI